MRTTHHADGPHAELRVYWDGRGPEGDILAIEITREYTDTPQRLTMADHRIPQLIEMLAAAWLERWGAPYRVSHDYAAIEESSSPTATAGALYVCDMCGMSFAGPYGDSPHNYPACPECQTIRRVFRTSGPIPASVYSSPSSPISSPRPMTEREYREASLAARAADNAPISGDDYQWATFAGPYAQDDPNAPHVGEESSAEEHAPHTRPTYAGDDTPAGDSDIGF